MYNLFLRTIDGGHRLKIAIVQYDASLKRRLFSISYLIVEKYSSVTTGEGHILKFVSMPYHASLKFSTFLLFL